jgi:non-ribosomal peptide synthetase component E (peptide arylation enzyme)
VLSRLGVRVLLLVVRQREVLREVLLRRADRPAAAALVHAADELVGDQLCGRIVCPDDAAHDVGVALYAERAEHDEHRDILTIRGGSQ